MLIEINLDILIMLKTNPAVAKMSFCMNVFYPSQNLKHQKMALYTAATYWTSYSKASVRVIFASMLMSDLQLCIANVVFGLPSPIKDNLPSR